MPSLPYKNPTAIPRASHLQDLTQEHLTAQVGGAAWLHQEVVDLPVWSGVNHRKSIGNHRKTIGNDGSMGFYGIYTLW